jgi:lipid-A-disaccharide synthase
MVKALQFGIVAGEKSGDILGASLICSLRKHFPNAKFIGIGGPEMLSLGCESLAPMDRLSVMGFVEPLGRLPELFNLKRKLQDRFLRERIDVFIGIDSPDFNLRLAKTLRKKGLKTVHFVSPSVWAYRKSRIYSIKKSVDLMLTLFPFESEIYENNDIPVAFVGHPLADLIGFEDRRSPARQLYGFSEDNKVIALMPGSRAGEISRLAPIFYEAAIHSLQKYPDLEFLIPYSDTKAKSLLSLQLNQVKMPLKERFNLVNNSHEAISASDFVIMASGTATLEAMLLRRPMIICYKLAPLSFIIGSYLLKIPYIGLPNLLLGKKIVPEYIQKSVTPNALSKEIDIFLNAPNSYQDMEESFYGIHKLLRGGASDKAAIAIENLMNKNKYNSKGK